MVIDAEIAARSVFFYGLQASTASQNIQHLRVERENGAPYKQYYSFNISKRRPKGYVRKRWGWNTATSSVVASANFFAGKPRESMDLRAVTLSPMSGSNSASSVSFFCVYETVQVEIPD